MNKRHVAMLTAKLWFPDVRNATADGLIAIGGDLETERLLLAYEHGIFPWFEKKGLIFWFSPPERMVLFSEEIHISRSMKKLLRLGNFNITENQEFERVIRTCADYHSQKNEGTWISEDFITAYINLHRKGYANSVEVWESGSGKLAGGMYGVSIGNILCGESMFSSIPNASKAAMIHICKGGKCSLIDCQVENSHLSSLGARLISRDEFLKMLKNGR